MVDKMMRIAGRGSDGTAKALKTDNNGRAEISSGEQIILTGAESLAPDTRFEVLNTRNPVTIDQIEFTMDKEFTMHIVVRAYVGDWHSNIMLTDLNSGTGVSIIRPDRIKNLGTSIFNILQYDTDNDEYKFSLKKPLTFPEGVLIEFVQTSTTTLTTKVAYMVVGSEHK